jgi:nucleoside-diphosphate kinase
LAPNKEGTTATGINWDATATVGAAMPFSDLLKSATKIIEYDPFKDLKTTKTIPTNPDTGEPCDCPDCQLAYEQAMESDYNYEQAMEGAPVVERTMVMLKPDAFQRGLVGELISIIERREMKLIACKQMSLTPDQVKHHYPQHVGKGFFPELIDFLTSGPVMACVFEGPNACVAVRQLIGGTKHPSEAPPGSIRGRFAMEFPANLIHGSDYIDEANREISLYFTEDEIFDANFLKKKEKELEIKKAEAEEQKQATLAKPLKKGAAVEYLEQLHEGDSILNMHNGVTYYIYNIEEKGDTFTILMQGKPTGAVVAPSYTESTWGQDVHWTFAGNDDHNVTAPQDPDQLKPTSIIYNTMTHGFMKPTTMPLGIKVKLKELYYKTQEVQNV